VVLGEALGAELAALTVIRAAADGDGLVVAHAEQHATTDRTKPHGVLTHLSGIREVVV
jgi:hypothetical protein